MSEKQNRKSKRKRKPGAIAVGLKRLRESKELTQQKLASLAKIDPSALSRYESGQTNMAARTLYRIVRSMGSDFVELGWIMRGETSPPETGLAVPWELSSSAVPKPPHIIMMEALILRVQELEVKVHRLTLECERRQAALDGQGAELEKQQDPAGEE